MSALMMLNELKLWDAATSDERRACALRAADLLPKAFIFDDLVSCSLGSQSHEIAIFLYDDCKFALLPGHTSAVLGYDRSQPFKPRQEHLDDWKLVENEFGCTIHQYLDECLTPLRCVTIAPFLVDTVAHRFDYAQDGDDQSDGYQRIQSEFVDGIRLPTTDEWEYACSGGTRSLFR